MAKKRLILEGDDLPRFIAMCLIVLEDCDGTAKGHEIHIDKRVVEELMQRGVAAKTGK